MCSRIQNPKHCFKYRTHSHRFTPCRSIRNVFLRKCSRIISHCASPNFMHYDTPYLILRWVLIRQQSSMGKPVGECRPEIFWYKLMNRGKQVIRAFGISDRIPCGMDTKISEANPESWSERTSWDLLAEYTKRNAWGWRS